MNAYPRWFCDICDSEFSTQTAAEKCCSRLIAQADPTEGRLPPKRSKQMDVQLAIPNQEVMYGKDFKAGLR